MLSWLEEKPTKWNWGRRTLTSRHGAEFLKEGHMSLGVGNIVALVCIVISVIFALVTHEAMNPLWWSLLAIFAVLWWGSKAPWGRD
jgi:hypothetical protein